MSTWGCPNDLEGICQLVRGAACDPGMRGCVLHGKVRFASAAQNEVRKPVKATPPPRPATRKKPNIN
ncbi:MAG: hypothetical protein HYZ17_17805 [Betaproteobacteria bacterium]|nr:hypothetical protein [Betaproteobacteria bacterium]